MPQVIENKMKIKFKNIDKEFLKKRNKTITKLLEDNFDDVDFNEDNITEAYKLLKEYNSVATDDLEEDLH